MRHLRLNYNKKNHYNILIIIAILLNGIINSAHAITEDDFQIWTGVLANGSITKSAPKVIYWLEYQGRFGENASRLSQLILRPGIGYQLFPSTSIWLGYAWIHSAPPFVTGTTQENRSWQQILWSGKSQRFAFTLRSRLEQRFLQNAIYMAWRYRQLLKISYPFPNHERFSLIGMDEFFYHINNYNKKKDSGFDQNRSFAGLGYKINQQSTFEIGYLNQYIRRHNRIDYSGNNLFLNLIINF